MDTCNRIPDSVQSGQQGREYPQHVDFHDGLAILLASPIALRELMNISKHPCLRNFAISWLVNTLKCVSFPLGLKKINKNEGKSNLNGIEDEQYGQVGRGFCQIYQDRPLSCMEPESAMEQSGGQPKMVGVEL